MSEDTQAFQKFPYLRPTCFSLNTDISCTYLKSQSRAGRTANVGFDLHSLGIGIIEQRPILSAVGQQKIKLCG